jgi:hypothetical protein
VKTFLRNRIAIAVVDPRGRRIQHAAALPRAREGLAEIVKADVQAEIGARRTFRAGHDAPGAVARDRVPDDLLQQPRWR